MTRKASPVLAPHLQRHGANIAPVAYTAEILQRHKRANGKPPQLTKRERREIAEFVAKQEAPYIVNGVNFSRVQIDELLQLRDARQPIAFETLGPYLADYVESDGRMTLDNLIPEDLIGLHLACLFRQIFPRALLVALCDEYNTVSARLRDAGEQVDALPYAFSPEQKQAFTTSLTSLLAGVGAIRQSRSAANYCFIAESERAPLAVDLVAQLKERGCIKEEGRAVYFHNLHAENPLCQTFPLRSKAGRWLCEALDAAAFLIPHKRDTTHVVVLPAYLKLQQDRVWEILRVLHIMPERYQNIFYDPSHAAPKVMATMAQAFGVEPPVVALQNRL